MSGLGVDVSRTVDTTAVTSGSDSTNSAAEFARAMRRQAEEEAQKLKGMIDSLNSVFEAVRGSTAEERERLRLEQSRLTMLTESLERERSAQRAAVVDERRDLQSRWRDLEQERTRFLEQKEDEMTNMAAEREQLERERAEWEHEVGRREQSLREQTEQLALDRAKLEQFREALDRDSAVFESRVVALRQETSQSTQQRRELVELQEAVHRDRERLARVATTLHDTSEQVAEKGSEASRLHRESIERLQDAEAKLRRAEQLEAEFDARKRAIDQALRKLEQQRADAAREQTELTQRAAAISRSEKFADRHASRWSGTQGATTPAVEARAAASPSGHMPTKQQRQETLQPQMQTYNLRRPTFHPQSAPPARPMTAPEPREWQNHPNRPQSQATYPPSPSPPSQSQLHSAAAAETYPTLPLQGVHNEAVASLPPNDVGGLGIDLRAVSEVQAQARADLEQFTVERANAAKELERETEFVEAIRAAGANDTFVSQMDVTEATTAASSTVGRNDTYFSHLDMTTATNASGSAGDSASGVSTALAQSGEGSVIHSGSGSRSASRSASHSASGGSASGSGSRSGSGTASGASGIHGDNVSSSSNNSSANVSELEVS